MKLLVSVLAAASANPTCDAGWDWDQTENNNTGACVDVNECNNGGCLGTNGANSCKNLVGTWECGCADGFTLQDDKQTCLNNNECAASENPCTDTNKNQCTDTYGGYECSCNSGWREQAPQESLDTGITWVEGNCDYNEDECLRASCRADSTCVDGDNSYTCPCNDGFQENINDECVDIDECAEESHTCGANTQCSNNDGGYTCECLSGFEKGDDPNACKDINECTAGSNPCTEPFKTQCSNNDGSYECGCDTGTALDDNNNCFDVDECAEGGHDCSDNAKCDNIVLRDGRITHRCACNEGYSGDGYKNGTTEGGVAGTGCVNNNECDNPDACPANSSCEDNDGSFTCTCNWPRWTSDGEGGCRDVNECTEGLAFSCNDPGQGVCSNTIGGYACDCNEPFWESDGGSGCQDVDECATNAHDCDSNASCTNIDGGWTCECNEFWEGDGTSCSDINECDDHVCGPNSSCVNNEGAAATCECNSGYEDVSNSTSPMDCQDSNECLSADNYNCTSDAGLTKCANNDGGYTCICDQGWLPEGDGCVDEPECGSLDNCDANAQCSDANGSFSCKCRDGFSGSGVDGDCADINECADNPLICGPNAGCTNSVPGYSCSCNSGYKLDADGNCVDKNECDGDGVFTCNEENKGQCVNTIGAYECDCNPGWEIQPDGKCWNINECADASLFSCDAGEKCADNDGGYDCVCEDDDYKKNSDNECVKIDFCSEPSGYPNNDPFVDGNTACGPGTCVDGTSASYSCNCPSGYEAGTLLVGEFKNETSTIPACVDINECDNNPCLAPKGQCTNSAGGHSCSCDDGYYMDADGNCLDYDECSNDAHDCDGAYAKCTNLSPAVNPQGYQCECITGFEMDADLNCQDLDECASAHHNCVGPNNSGCTDTDGSYFCKCAPGFSRSDDSSDPFCYDDNECDDENICSRRNQNVCVNNAGSYDCNCNAGFNFDADMNCQDINECDTGDFVCGQLNTECDNNVGGYDCVCADGFEGADPKNGNCTDIDECTNNPDLCGSNGVCNNNDGGFECVCNVGWKLNDAGDDCVDIDECNFDQSYTYTCNENAKEKCVNTEGSYKCACNQGYKADDNGDCTDIDECKSEGNECHENATCENIVLRNGLIGYTCACNDGYQGDGVNCENINECTNGAHKCGSLSLCEDNDGSYVCNCNDGYFGDGNLESDNYCANINECDASAPGSSDGAFTCTDAHQGQCSDLTPGYECLCESGFEATPGGCEDINECNGVNECGANTDCENVDGSYNCACKDGYSGNPYTPAGCSDINECEDAEICESQPDSHCVNAIGGYACKCNSGYEEENNKCVDINECTENTYECNDVNQSRCSNTIGGYECLCEVGFNTNSTGFCVDIDECQKAGDNCDKNADCTNLNMDDDGKTHACTCKAGFLGNGFECSDIDECVTQVWNGTHNNPVDSGICGNGACTNAVGGYSCSCDAGWEVSDKNPNFPTCVDSNECADNFDCSASNQGVCSNNDGGYDCVCNPGYEWDFPQFENNRTCVDINECENNDDNCAAEATCVNLSFEENPNGFGCDCNDGYQGNGTHCGDIDECDLGEHDCTVTENTGCVNNIGSFTCDCLTGYHDEHNDGVCVDIQECASHTVHQCTADSTCSESAGSYSCPCDSGYRGDGFPGANGCDDIDECAEGTHECSEYASCTNTLGGYSCECQGDWIGDGKECSMCPSNECWNYDHESKTCTPIQNETCSILVCGYDGISASFDNNLFGISSGKENDQVWGSINTPSWQSGDGKWALNAGLGDAGVSSSTDGDNIVFSVWVSISSENRARSGAMATNQEYQFDNVTTVQTGPFAVGISFSCSYPRTIEVSSDSYDFEDASITDSFSGVSSLNQAFYMTLNNGDGVSFVLGATLPVTVGWDIQGVEGISLYFSGCTVSHGSSAIAVIKDSCFSETLNAEPRASEGLTTSFSFRVFKGKGESAPSQTIQCSVVICKDDDDTCGPITSDADCPSDSGYNYYAKQD